MEDLIQPEVQDGIEQCQRAGIEVRLITGDSALTARSIAKRCGILVDGNHKLVMEGKEFSKLTDSAKKNILPNLSVLARASCCVCKAKSNHNKLYLDRFGSCSERNPNLLMGCNIVKVKREV